MKCDSGILTYSYTWLSKQAATAALLCNERLDRQINALKLIEPTETMGL